MTGKAEGGERSPVSVVSEPNKWPVNASSLCDPMPQSLADRRVPPHQGLQDNAYDEDDIAYGELWDVHSEDQGWRAVASSMLLGVAIGSFIAWVASLQDNTPSALA